jgi:uncharacterized protein
MTTTFPVSGNAEIQRTCPLGRELTERLLKILTGFCDQEGGCHGPDHTTRVHRMALWIGREMGADLKVLSAAALLHDVGRADETRSRGTVCHAGKGAELARSILNELGLAPAIIDKVVHCIAAHRYRGDEAPASLEARILFDADKLDSIGAIGIGRAFLFAGQIGARLHNDNSVVEGTEAYSVEDTAYREFKVKMGRIKDGLLTPLGRQLAQERHQFMEMFFARLENEINQPPIAAEPV